LPKKETLLQKNHWRERIGKDKRNIDGSIEFCLGYLPSDSRFASSNPAKDNGIFKGDKIP
jgi:hypothetical protein